MRSRTFVGWLVAVLLLCLATDSAAAGIALLPGDGNDERRVTLASRRPARQPKLQVPRPASRLVLVSSTPAPAHRQPPVTAPDGQVVCWRRHANGQLAAVVGHADGTMTARLWPGNDVFSTGIRTLTAAQRAADSLAHVDSGCTSCRPWAYS